MITVSLCMIVRDEEEVIGSCLDSTGDLVDEVIIVDTGSVDKTKEIASRYTSKIYDFKWINDFSAARNYSFSQATMDYIFWLDADDVLLKEDRAGFAKLKETVDSSVDVVMMKYVLSTGEDGKPTLSCYRERLLKRLKNFRWYDPIHEYMVFDGNIINSDISITHKKIPGRSVGRNLAIFEKILAEGRELSERNYFYYAKELYVNGRYEEAVEFYLKFLDTEGGHFTNYLDSCIDLSKIYDNYVKDNKQALRMLLRSFEYGIPRAEVCCLIGYRYKKAKDYPKAIFWFDLATKLNKPNSWGSIIHDCWDFLPYLELSICYFKTGNLKAAIKYNNKAAEYKPGHPVVTHNKEFFQTVLQEQDMTG